MVKQYILTETEIEDIRNNIEQIRNRIDQLELEEREVDYMECLVFKEKLNNILEIIWCE